jgi:hypothetical protein
VGVGREVDRVDELLPAILDALTRRPALVARLRELLGERPAAYTVESLAAAVGISPKAVRNAIARGDLAAVKRGGRWIVSAAAADRWSEPGADQRYSKRGMRASGEPMADALARFTREIPSTEVKQ